MLQRFCNYLCGMGSRFRFVGGYVGIIKSIVEGYALDVVRRWHSAEVHMRGADFLYILHQRILGNQLFVGQVESAVFDHLKAKKIIGFPPSNASMGNAASNMDQQKETVPLVSEEINLIVDVQPFILFAEILQRFCQVRKLSLDLTNLGFELIRVDTDTSTTSAGELSVRLYPSDAFLDFAGAIFTRNADFSVI